MNLRQSLIIQLVLLGVCAAISFAYAPHMPATVPTHWGPSGKPDGWGSPTLALWMGPVLVGFTLLLTIAIPWFPGGKNVGRFTSTYGKMMVIVSSLMAFLHVTILQATRGQTDMPATLLTGMFLFFAAMGNLMGKVKPNPYMGIRTPWTLSSEKVWEISHRRAAYIYVVGGLIGAVLMLAGLPMLVAIIYLVVYSVYPILDSYLVSKRVAKE